MNKTNLKSYAPKARLDFIKAVTARANVLGISAAGSVPAEVRGAVAIIDGREWSAKVSGQRDQLIERIRKDGFAQTMEAIAYTWFNRFAALRYMELHDYLGHGHRALSSAQGTLPDILTHAMDLTSELPSLNAAKVTELKLAGNRDGELYRMLLVAQCNALSRAMPFLFERIDDDSELLLPDNLLRSDSVIAKLVDAIPEGDWAEVEIIGWLYQFYISEKKDQVIGKVVKSEDIPAATQLFTPNWIVQYLVQNSVGRLWLMANPQSTLAKEWPYYITPAEQTPEVQAQLDALIQTRVREDGDTLNPESITVLDPACGSGHILVVAYDVLKAIYLERGYQPRAIPRLILEKNLYGLDIDDRAAQMAGFALLMKARADDRRLFTATDDAGNLQPPMLNVLSLQESKGLSVDELATHLAPFQVQRATITALVYTFENAKTFGSLIQIPYVLKTYLSVLPEVLALVKQSGDMYASAAADDLLPLVKQAQVLAMQFDAVVANPPYMGRKGLNTFLNVFIDKDYPASTANLFAAFVERSFVHAKASGFVGLMTPSAWMFLKSYELLRCQILADRTLNSLIEPEYHAFFDSAFVSVCTFVFQNAQSRKYAAQFIRLADFYGADIQSTKALEAIDAPDCGWRYVVALSEFEKLPGNTLAYWVSQRLRKVFEDALPLGEVVDAAVGLQTGNNDRFLRLWFEVSQSQTCHSAIGRDLANMSGKKWFPYNKGGSFRRWHGNHEYVVNWENDGREIRTFGTEDGGRPRSRAQNTSRYFQPSLSWSDITSGPPSFRLIPAGFIHDVKGMSAFAENSQLLRMIAGFCNSPIVTYAVDVLNPGVNFQVGNFIGLPYLMKEDVELQPAVLSLLERLLPISISDWDTYERSWEFKSHPLTTASDAPATTLEASYVTRTTQNSKAVLEMKRLEEENNRLFIEAYGLTDELSPFVSVAQISLTVNPAYRYGGKLSEQEQLFRFRQDTSAELISYAIGCMMGRYSLNEPGLIYAHAGNVGFEPFRYATFPADADGIVPITDELWFADDAPSRIREFLRAVWGQGTLEENMAWLAESLGTKASETPDKTIRRYIADKFFKDHLQTYKKRPIYWLFSSGKQGAFQALVYLHRYNESTLSRLRAEYVAPLIAKLASRLDMLDKDVAAASSAAARTKLQKQIESLRKKQIELLAYDEKLRHFADMRITLDLDDGVKVNYGKFGDLLDSVKVVTGGGSDD